MLQHWTSYKVWNINFMHVMDFHMKQWPNFALGSRPHFAHLTRRLARFATPALKNHFWKKWKWGCQVNVKRKEKFQLFLFNFNCFLLPGPMAKFCTWISTLFCTLDWKVVLVILLAFLCWIKVQVALLFFPTPPLPPCEGHQPLSSSCYSAPCYLCQNKIC